MSTLYLHIGTPKTGTSAIQRFMAENRRLLKKKGYCYPDFKISFPGIWQNRNGHFLVHKIYDKKKNNLIEQENALVAKCLKKIFKAAEHYPNIVISDEGIWRASEKKERFWETLKEQLNEKGIDLKIVVFLRRQDLFIQSYWAQMVKETLTVPFSQYIAEGKYQNVMLDYNSYLNKIASVTGQENIIVRVYEKQPSIIADFLESIQLEDDMKYKNTDLIQNISLSGICLEVKRFLNHMPEFKEKSSYIVPLLKEVQIESDHLRHGPLFLYDEQQKFLEKYAEGNSEVARQYLKKEDGILFHESTCRDEHTKDTYSTKELIAVCGKLITLQQQRIEHLRKYQYIENIFLRFVNKMKSILEKCLPNTGK